MKKIFLFAICALMSVACFGQELTKESKEGVKADLKKFEKNGWKGAGADSDMKKALERSYVYIQDTLNYVVVEAAASQIDAKNAIAAATEVAQGKVLKKAAEVLKARGEKAKNLNGDLAKNILSFYKNEKKREDGAKAYVRVALKITN